MFDRKSVDFYFYSHLSVVQSPKELKQAIVRALEPMGLDSFRFTVLGVEQPRQLSNWSELLLKVYEDYYEFDLIARQGDKTIMKPVYQSAIIEYLKQSPFELDVNDKFLALCRQAAKYGCLDTYNITYKTIIGINCLFTVTKLGVDPEPFRALIETHQPLLYLLGDISTNFAISRFAPFFIGQKAFMRLSGVTPKQLQLLRILAKDNVTLKDAAEKMHISKETANKHIAAIKLALSAKTQATAIYRGIVTGLIDIDNRQWD